MSDYTDRHTEAREQSEDNRVAAWEAHQADRETTDGPYHAGLEREA